MMESPDQQIIAHQAADLYQMDQLTLQYHRSISFGN